MYTNDAIKKAAKGQLSYRWSRAVAILAMMLMANMAIFIIRQLGESILSLYGMSNGLSFLDGVENLQQFLERTGEFIASPTAFYMIVIELFLAFCTLLIISPMRQGATAWYYSVASGSSGKLKKLFSYYKTNDSYVSVLLFRIALTIRRVIIAAISFAPAVVSFGLAIAQYNQYLITESLTDFNNTGLYVILGIGLILLGIALCVLLNLRYFLAPYLFSMQKAGSKSSMKVNSFFKRSAKMMSGETGRVVSLVMSMMPQLFLCLLIFPILYVYPYINCSLAVLARDIIENENE